MSAPAESPSSAPSTPRLRYQPLRTPLLEASQLPSAPHSPPSPSRHTHIHIHSHSHHFPSHPPLPPLDSSSTTTPWLLSSQPTSPSKAFSTSPAHASPLYPCLPCPPRLQYPLSLPFSVKFFLLICALSGFLFYQTHLCAEADSHPHSTLSFLHSTLHRSHVHQLASPYTSSSPSTSLLSLELLSSPPSPLPSSFLSLSPSSSTLLDPWSSRLLPITVELEAGYAWLTLNLVTLTGAAHSPPLYDGLPCIRTVPPSPSAPCTPGVLQLSSSEQYSVTIIPQLQRQDDATYSPTTEMGEWRWLSERQVAHLIGTDLPAQLRREAGGEEGEVTLLSAAQAMANVILPVVARVKVPGLMEGRTYRFAVQVGNRTHRTTPLLSLPCRTLPQVELWQAERDRISRYLNLISEPSGLLPSPFSPPLPFRSPVPISPDRQPAPFESATLACPAAFLAYVDDYRAFHSRQVQRLRSAKGDVGRLAGLVAHASDPVRLLVSGVYRWSGVTDRASAFTGLYLVAMLTRRVLLLDDDWPDIQRVMLSPLTLSLDMVAPRLRDAALHNWTQQVEVTDVGPKTDDYERHYHAPIVFITSIKGIIMRLLTESANYSQPLQQLGLTPDNAIGCMAHSLWTVRLSSLLAYSDYQPVMSTLLSSTTRSIGIQIRSWHDFVFLNTAAAKKRGAYTPHSTIDTADMQHSLGRQVEALTEFGTQGFFHCAQDWSDTLRLHLPPPPLSRIVWFLVSDDEAVRAAAVSRWGPRSASPSSPPSSPFLLSLLSSHLLGHSNAVDLDAGFLYLRHALVEQFLFSLTHFAVISQASGYGRWPALLGLRGRRVFVLNNDQQNVTKKAAKTCMDEDKDGMTILDLSREWSKV